MPDTRPNKLTQEDKDLALALHKKGVPNYKIAARLGVAPNSINRIVRKFRQQLATTGR